MFDLPSVRWVRAAPALTMHRRKHIRPQQNKTQIRIKLEAVCFVGGRNKKQIRMNSVAVCFVGGRNKKQIRMNLVAVCVVGGAEQETDCWARAAPDLGQLLLQGMLGVEYIDLGQLLLDLGQLLLTHQTETPSIYSTRYKAYGGMIQVKVRWGCTGVVGRLGQYI